MRGNAASFNLPVSILFCTLFFAPLLALKAASADTGATLLFSFSRNNGEDGLHLATSTNGLQWTDATLPPARGKFCLVVKDETRNPVKKHLRLAVGDRAQSSFGKAGLAITGDWVEGLSAIQLDGAFYIYFDPYTRPQYYAAVKSTDLEHWQDISPQVSFPPGTRHGTVLKVPEQVVRNLQNQVTNTQL